MLSITRTDDKTHTERDMVVLLILVCTTMGKSEKIK